MHSCFFSGQVFVAFQEFRFCSLHKVFRQLSVEEESTDSFRQLRVEEESDSEGVE